MVTWRRKRGSRFGKMPWWFVGISAVGTIYGSSVLIKQENNFDKNQEHRIVGKTVLITGASSGIGLETSKELASRGGRVLLACKDRKKCEIVRKMIIDQTNNPSVVCYDVDLSSCKSIHKFADDIKTNEKRLDILINNAGVMGVPESTTEDGFETHLGVNYLGPFLLTNLLMDKLKASALPESPSRIINITSHSHTKFSIYFRDLNLTGNYSYNDAYAQSKLALIFFTQELADRFSKDNISSYAVTPKTADTQIGRYLAVNQSLSFYILRPLIWLMLSPPEKAISTIIKCAVDPSVSYKTGEYWYSGKIAEASPTAHNPNTQSRLWITSEVWTKLKQH